jgi:hypothetical protein
LINLESSINEASSVSVINDKDFILDGNTQKSIRGEEMPSKAVREIE